MFANEFKVNQFLLHYCRLLAADIADEQMTDQPAPCVNHPAWILGHLAFSAEMIVDRLGGEKFLPPQWADLFKPGSTPRAAAWRLSGQGRAAQRAGGCLRACPQHDSRGTCGNVDDSHAESANERGPADAPRDCSIHTYRPPRRTFGPTFLLAANDRAAGVVLGRNRQRVGCVERFFVENGGFRTESTALKRCTLDLGDSRNAPLSKDFRASPTR